VFLGNAEGVRAQKEAGLLDPDFTQSYWKEFTDLVKWRSSIVDVIQRTLIAKQPH